MMKRMTPQQIKDLREALGMRTTELAVAVGVTDDAVRKWERGAGKPSGSAMILLYQLAEKLKQTPVATPA
jgi:DNA-binding transcriptional regulator YiaG